MFSLADSISSAPFITISTQGSLGSRSVSLTRGHHLPVGSSCCSRLQMAGQVELGTQVWVASPNGTLVQQRVIRIAISVAGAALACTSLYL